MTAGSCREKRTRFHCQKNLTVAMAEGDDETVLLHRAMPYINRNLDEDCTLMVV